MRHRVYGKHLGRSKNERTGLFRNLVSSLVISEKIQTTETKAKAIKGLVDKLINQAKSPTTRRLVSQFLVHKPAHDKLVNDLVPRLQTRNSGYTSTIKLGRRAGDGAMVVQMSLLVEESKSQGVKESGKKDAKISKAAMVEAKETMDAILEGEVVSKEKPKKEVKKVAAKKEKK